MFFLVCFIVGGLCWVIWYFFSEELTWMVREVRKGELQLVKLLFGSDYTRYVVEAQTTQTVGQWLHFLKNRPLQEFTTDHIVMSTEFAVVPLKFVFLALMGIMCIFVMFRGPGTQYRRRMNLEQLMQEQSQSFPAIKPFLKFDPRKMPSRAPGQPLPSQLPLFAEALSPEEWLAYHQVSWSGGRLDYNAAFHALAEQLGDRWRGPEHLSVHAQGIYAACALKLVRKRKDAEQMMNMLAESWSAEGGFRPSAKLRSKIKAVIKNPKIGGELRVFADQHAYNTTAMLRCLQRAREEGGVLAPAEFVWLRGHDRTLWYPMNNLGRKSYCAEAAGALVHFTNELIAGQKIPTPRFDEVIRGIETYMKSPGARAIPELEQKGRKKG